MTAGFIVAADPTTASGAADVVGDAHVGDVGGGLVHVGPARTVTTDYEPPAANRRRRRWWLLAAAVLVLVAVGGWVVGQQVQSADQAASQAAPPAPSWITVGVERRVLAQTVISRGDVRPQVSILVGVPSSIEGSPVVTAIGVAVGDAVTEGTRVMEVSGRPVFVLTGDVPVYRSLKPGMTGADVAQLQAALTRLGCDTTTDAAVYAGATKACVAKMYTDAGYEPVPTSATEAADLAAAGQAIVDAQAGVDSAQLALDNAAKGPSDAETLAASTALKAAKRGYNDAVASSDAAVKLADGNVTRAQAEFDRVNGDPTSTPAAVDAAQGDLDAAIAAAAEARRTRTSTVAAALDSVTLAQAAVDELAKDPDVSAEFTALGQALAARDRAQATFDALQNSTGAIIPQGEVVFAPSLPARVQQAVTTLGPIGADTQPGAVDGGQTAAAGAELATLAAGDLVVSMTLRAGDRGLVRVGMGVELLDEQSNTNYPATITSIADAQTTGNDGQAGFAMVITPDAPLPDDLSGINMRVTITAASTETPTLVVPVAAVSSAADGSTNVSILPAGAASDADPVIVPVIAGISADGFVSIEPAVAGGLAEGDRVVVGR